MKRNLLKTIFLSCSIIFSLGMASCSEESNPEVQQPALSGSVSAATSSEKLFYYLQINGIEGECKETKHDKWIEVIDFSHGSTLEMETGSLGVAGDSKFEPFVFTHKIDKSTPLLQSNCMKGTVIKFAQLDVAASILGKQEVIYRIKMDLVTIVSTHVYSVINEDGSQYIMEKVEMMPDKMTWQKTSVGLDNSIGGTTEASYDQTKKC